MSEPEFDREMAEALENAETAEVVCVILPVINQCLVYDSRSATGDPPRMTVSAPLGSGERRLRHVNKARPHLERARELAVLPWSGSINAFEGSGRITRVTTLPIHVDPTKFAPPRLTPPFQNIPPSTYRIRSNTKRAKTPTNPSRSQDTQEGPTNLFVHTAGWEVTKRNDVSHTWVLGVLARPNR